MQLSLFDNLPQTTIGLADLFEAYFDCRKNKRNNAEAIGFEINYESNLVRLCEEINNGTYTPGRSVAFIIDKPVKREIFAADFRDRVVHHFIIGKINHLFEKHFIYDTYSCRTGKGTHLGIHRIDRFIKLCSEDYTKDCYILKLDIQGFFMHINKDILFDRLHKLIANNYRASDLEKIVELCRRVIYNDCTKNCVIKGDKQNWAGLPATKSLFHSPENCGLPIGNLTSQIFANFYMDAFDHYVQQDLGISYYGRYVDDFILVHPDKEFLKSRIPILRDFLSSRLKLTLHPKKIYLQHYTKGVKFLGTVIKPHRIYIAKRTIGNFYTAIEKQNNVVKEHKPTKEEKAAFLCSMNSYLGLMKHYRSYNIRKKMLFKNLSAWWWNHVYLSGGIAKFVLKTKHTKHSKRQLL